MEEEEKLDAVHNQVETDFLDDVDNADGDEKVLLLTEYKEQCQLAEEEKESEEEDSGNWEEENAGEAAAEEANFHSN